MTTTAQKDTGSSGATQLVDSIQDVEKASLEAVRKFVDTVDGAFPDVGDNSPRRKIIDSAFEMVEQLVNATNDLTRGVLKATEGAMGDQRTPTGKHA